jgi:hypothetical protein
MVTVSVFLRLFKAVHDADVEDFQRRGRVNRAVQRKGEHDRLLEERRGRGKVLRRREAGSQPRTNSGQVSRVRSLADVQHVLSLSHLDLYGISNGKRRH